MNIIVCLKPNVESTAMSYDPRTGVPILPASYSLAEQDAVALQLALDLRQTAAASITALSIAGDNATPLLEQALQLGADRAVRLWQGDDSQPIDTWVAGNAAGSVARTLEATLVICGARSDDIGDEFFAAALAAAANFELVVRAIALTRGEQGTLNVVQKLESGWRISHFLQCPAVIAVEAETTRARHNTILGRAYRAGLARPVESWEAEDAGFAVWPLALVEEVELALPRARAKAVKPQMRKVSAKDRLRRKKKTEDTGSTQQTLAGAPDSVAEQLLGLFKKWLA